MTASPAAAAPPALPDPQSGQLEVSFRRLLESCLKHLQAPDAAAAASSSSPGSATATTAKDDGGQPSRVGAGPAATEGATANGGGQSSNSSGTNDRTLDDSERAARVLKMKHYVDTLRELLADLRGQQDALGLDTATLDLYDTHVKAVAAAVPKVQLPPYCQNLITGSAVAPSSAAGGGGSRPAPNLSYFTPPPARPGVAPSSTSRGAPSGRGTEVGGLSTAASERLREAEAAQALLTDELAGLTAALKANAMGMAGAVADRGKLLDATDAALTDSLAATKRNVATAGERVKSSRGSLCFTCMVMLVVGLLFTAMVLYIKFTSMLGYRAHNSGPPAASSHQPASSGGGGGGWLAGGGGGWGEGSYGGDTTGGELGGVPEQSYGEPDPWQGHGGEL